MENAALSRKIETSSETHARADIRLAEVLVEMRNDLGRKRRENDALRAMAGELKKRLATLHKALYANYEKKEEFESRVASDIKAIAYLTILVKVVFRVIFSWLLRTASCEGR